MPRTELTRVEFVAQRPDRDQDGENHYSWGAILLWEEGGKQYQEHQPDLGQVKFYVADIPQAKRRADAAAFIADLPDTGD